MLCCTKSVVFKKLVNGTHCYLSLVVPGLHKRLNIFEKCSYFTFVKRDKNMVYDQVYRFSLESPSSVTKVREPCITFQWMVLILFTTFIVGIKNAFISSLLVCTPVFDDCHHAFFFVDQGRILNSGIFVRLLV